MSPSTIARREEFFFAAYRLGIYPPLATTDAQPRTSDSGLSPIHCSEAAMEVASIFRSLERTITAANWSPKAIMPITPLVIAAHPATPNDDPVVVADACAVTANLLFPEVAIGND